MNKLKIAIINIHGLVKGSGLEIGRDADNGGQTKYVFELAEELSKSPLVEKIYIFTRLIIDREVSSEYSKPIEVVNPKFEIRRIPFAGKKYKPKEQLWEHLDTMVANTVQHLKKHNIFPNWLHSHYGDAGYVASELSTILNIPFAHTGHSLGIHKKNKLLASGENLDEINKKFKFPKRIAAEEKTLELSEFIVTSTEQEIETYSAYEQVKMGKFHAIAPGIDTTKFHPYFSKPERTKTEELEAKDREYWVSDSIEKFLTNPHKPAILALSRPDRRKNLHTLIEVYGNNKELQSMANLVIFAGIRKDINQMHESEKEVLTNLLLSMDKYDLYGKMAIPKKHDVDNEVAIIYRYCAEKRGVFMNLTDHENFGLTIIESSSSGLPVIVTQNGGPSEIIPKCESGLLVDPTSEKQIKEAVHKVLTNEQAWRSYSSAGSINVQKLYSWQSHADQYLSLVQENLELSSGVGIKKKNYPGINIDRLKNKVDKLIISDIDGTLIEPSMGNPGLNELKLFLHNRHQKMAFAFATGRNLDLVKEAITSHELPLPDFVICSVGSEIYYTNGTEYILDKGWATYLSGRWRREELLNRLKKVKWLKLQEENAQKQFKISFTYKKEDYSNDQLVDALGPYWYRVSIINSHGKFLDILPKRASKGNAIQYLCHKWSISLRDTFAAGDSGNDIDMFRGPIRGIVVGNKSEELCDIESNSNLFIGNEPAASGILEGLKHFGLIE